MTTEPDLEGQEAGSDVEQLIAQARQWMSPEQAARMDEQLRNVRARQAQEVGCACASPEAAGTGEPVV